MTTSDVDLVTTGTAAVPRASAAEAWLELTGAPAAEQLGTFDTEGAVGRHLHGCMARAIAAVSDGVQLEVVHWAGEEELAAGRLRFALGGHTGARGQYAVA